MQSIDVKVADQRACLAVRPLFDRLHIAPLAESFSDTIEIQRKALEFKVGYSTTQRITRGLVLYAGPDVKEVHQGEIVVFSDTCSRELTTDETREYLIRESDVIEADGRIIGDIVIIDPVVPEYTKGLVVLPSFRPKIPEGGTVMEMGPGRLLKDGRRVPMEIKIGDVVMIPKYSGQEIIRQGKACLAIRYPDLNGVIYGIRDVLI